jgi:hypothetical protein
MRILILSIFVIFIDRICLLTENNYIGNKNKAYICDRRISIGLTNY